MFNTIINILFTLLFSSVVLYAQNEDLKIKTIPYELKRVNDFLKLEIKGDSVVTITADANTNLFNNPQGTWNRQNAPMLLFHPDSNFVFKAKVTAELKEIFDVAALVVYYDKDSWAKLCFENSADKEAMVVSVVTNKYSDDCNSTKLSNKNVYLAIAKKGKEFSFHYSNDGINWELVRHFRLDYPDSNMMIGFAVHCYASKMFSANFSEIIYSGRELNNMRKLK